MLRPLHASSPALSAAPAALAVAMALALLGCGGDDDGGGGDGGDRPGAADGAPGAPDGDPSAEKIIFVTSQRYPADLRTAGSGADGLEGADNLCQLAAQSVGLTGTFRAWLSSSTEGALGRISGDGPWVGMDGTLLFPNRASLSTVPMDGISFDERGEQPDPFYEAWTGTGVGGAIKPAGERDSVTCLDWTSTVDSEQVCGHLGLLQRSDDDWTDYQCGYCSPFSRHLYCLEM